ncbi:BspA family leucine-rich repeat surface protein, partial [Flavobacteriaceae bacterium]|nr:BspA family leucine-rich repeat surface protein [Flavobacteriaceae bacterium]
MKYNLFFLLFGCYLYSQTSTVPSGSGTNTDPFLIESLSELLWVSEQVYGGSDWSLNKVFLQTNDIDASNTSTWTNGWIPIGGRTSPSVASTTDQTSQSFRGKYEGNNHTISNLHINNSLNYNGLFGSILSANISNLHLIDVAITTSGNKTGGLVGFSRNGKIYNSSSSGTVTSTGESVAGLIAQNNNGTIDSSYSTVNVFQTDNSVAGVLVALNQGTVKNCYSNGTIKGIDKFGGLIGSNSKSGTTVTNSYSNSEVTLYSGSGTIYGGLVGELHTGIISDVNYWNTTKTVSGIGQINTNETFSAVGRADAELKQQINFSGWDFKNETDNGNEDIWEIGSDGYPVFYNKGNVWTGATDTSWNNTSNWSQGILPGGTGLESKNIVTFPAGLTNYPSTSTANNKRAYSIKIENNAIDSSLYTFDSGTLIINDNILNVTLTDTDSDNIVSNSDVVTITATFSESMAATPTLSLSGIITNTEMTATSSASIWTYAWTVSTTVTSTTATVSGTDLSGNAYAGTDSITFTIDNILPTVTLTDTDSDNLVSNSDVVTITATFSESISATPTLSLSGIITNTEMTATASALIWTYAWTVSTTVTSTNATVSGTDLAGNAYAGSDSITFTIDNVPPKAGSYQIAAYEYFEYDELAKLESLNGGSGWSGAWIDYGATNEKQGHYILSQTSRGNTDSSQSDGIYALNQRSSMTYPGLTISGNYLGGINWQTDVPTKSYRELYRKFGEDIYVQFLVQFNDFDNADDTKVKNNYFILQEDDTERLVIRRKNGRIYMAKTTSSSASNDIVDTGVALKGSTDAQLVIVNIGASKTKIWVDPDLSSFDYSNPPAENAYLNYSFEFNRINIESQNKYINGVPSLYDEITIFERSGSLSDTDSDNIVSNSDVVTITATFSESMAATPTLSLSGIITNTEMTATSSASIWTYAWTVSTTVTSTTATVSGTDLSGNAYAGTDSITFTIDNILPTVTLTDTDSDNLVSNSDVVTITATFSESMTATPTLSLSGITSNVLMTATASTSVWTYAWTVSTSINSIIATVSGTDLVGNAYAGTDSITFTIDNILPTVILTDTDSDNLVSNSDVVTITATFSESMSATPTLNLSGITSNALMSATDSASVWTYTWTVSTTVTSTTANVSGTDLLGNLYSGNESIVFIVDDSAYIVLDSNGITVKATSAAVIGNTYALNGTFYTVVDDTNIASQIDGGNYNLCTTRVTDFSNLFMGNNDPNPSTFNSDISFWDTSNGTTMKNLFNLAVDFDQDLSAWDTSNVIDMSYMFKKAYKYNNGSQNGIGDWDTSKVTTMNRMFERAYKFNQDIGDWDTSSVLNMEWMFHNAIVFNQDISEWCVSSISEEPNNFLDPAPAFVNSSYEPNWGICPDKISPIVILTNTDADKIVSNSDVLTITATFSESMSATPTLSLSGIISNALMSATDSASVWTYAWTVSTTVTLSTATVSGTDLAGNAYAGTESLVFQIKPLNSGGASPIKSTISITPQEMIANSLNSATITVQAKDSVGQNFLTGGAKIRIFALSTEYTVLDNNNGTYSASFIPDAIQTDTKDVNFTFSVEGITATNEFNLLLHRDQDGDGVYDINDTCPRTDSGFEVDAKGCALNQLDSDNDGVFDDVDECPDTPEQELNNVQGTPTYGELIPTVVDEKGCGASQRDTDGDGIVDTEDNCIETANADQADTDGDGIGDVCDTDNPLPQITSTEIKFVQLPQNGTTVGKIEATDPDGEVLTFTQAGDNFKGVLSIASDGSITVSSGALLTFDSAYNGASLGFTLSDGVNEVTGSVKIVIEDAPRPPEISIITLEVSEDAQEGTIVGFVEAKDPMGGQIVSILLQGDGFIELVDGVLKT